MAEKKTSSVLDEFKLDFEDPYPKRSIVNLNKQRKIRRFIGYVGHNVRLFFKDIYLAIKELLRKSL